MKKLFKRIVASVLTAAIAMSAAVTSVSAADTKMTVTGTNLKDTAISIEVGKTDTLTVADAAGTVTVASDKTSVATAALKDTTITLTAVAEGSAKVTVTDAGADADSTDDDVVVEITVTVTKFETAAAKLYTDEAASKEVTDAGVFAYVNGTKTKGDNAVDYKSVKLYAKDAAKGKYVAVLTAENKQPAITAGKVVSDATVKNIAKVAVKEKTVTLTAGKQTGTVYVWLFDMDTTKKIPYSVAKAKVTMKGAASSVVISDTAISAGDKGIKTAAIGSGETATFNFASFIKDADKTTKNTLAADLTYTVEADAKNKITLTVTYDAETPGEFQVKAPEITPDTKGKVKTASGKVTVTNVQSGKKVSLTIVVGNDITATASEIKTGYATLIDEKGDVSKIDVNPTMSNDKIATTNKVSVVVLNGEAKFNEKAKLTTAKSKTFGAKLQSMDFGSKETPAPGYRVRLTYSAPKKDAANAVVYLVVTDAAKKTTYYEIARATKEGAVTATDGCVAVVQEAPKPVVS